MNGNFLNTKLITCTLLILSVIVVPVQAGGFFSGGADSSGGGWGGGSQASFDGGPGDEVFTAEGTNDGKFGADDMGSDSLDEASNEGLDFGLGDDDDMGGFGGGGSEESSDAAYSDSLLLQDPTAPVHTQNYYDKLNPEVDEEYVYHPVSVYDRKNQKKEGEADVQK